MKKTLDPNYYPLILPVTLVGANVNGKPNFQTTLLVGVINNNPMTVAVSINKKHHTAKGILEHNNFSLNIPSEDLVVETDYCGITSGREVDKSEIFSVFYGELKTAPMIDECKLTMECKVIDQRDLGRGICFIAEIVKMYADDEIITKRPNKDGTAPNFAKLRPLIGAESGWYHGIGERIANAYSAGKEYEKKKKNQK